MKLPFLGQAYQSRSPILASQTLINLYAESTEGNSQQVAGFYGTPGLTTVVQGIGEVRGLHATDHALYAVIGSTAYRISASWSMENLGDLPDSSGRVSITDNGTQVAFAHSAGWHWVGFSGGAIAPVPNSPPGSVLATQDNYVVFTASSGGQFGVTALADLSTINPLDIASAEGAPDNLVTLISDHREVVLFCTGTTEIWSDTGASFFPFERSPGGFVEQGCAAKWSPAKLDNSVFWLGRDPNGQGVVYRANAYIPQRISTHALEHAINEYDTISDAIGFSYQQEGHSFYWLVFPSADESWVYDVATSGWHRRAWADSSGVLHRHRANCYATFNGKHLVGDYQNGMIYELDLDVSTDNGDPIYRERAFEVPQSEDHRVRLDYLEIMATSGDGGSPQVWMEISRDGGRRFGYRRYKSLGAIGQRKTRLRWRHLGMGRNVVVKIATAMSGVVEWSAAYGKGEVLDQ